MTTPSRPGLFANINAKRARIERGSGEQMRQPGSPGAPTERALRESAMTRQPVSRSARKSAKGARPSAQDQDQNPSQRDEQSEAISPDEAE